jgi:hypothetical protein
MIGSATVGLTPPPLIYKPVDTTAKRIQAAALDRGQGRLTAVLGIADLVIDFSRGWRAHALSAPFFFAQFVALAISSAVAER